MPKSLYICYFGLREPLVQTQVIPYLREIIKDDTEVTLLTFEPELKKNWTSEQIKTETERLAGQGIDWHCLAYHKRPSAIATAYDIVTGAWFIRQTIGRKRIDILHGRVHIPTLMGAIARRFSARKPKLLFDIRGFFPEEYTDAGIWPQNGLLYRSAKKIEKWLMTEADGFVVLTQKARDILFPDIRPGAAGRDDNESLTRAGSSDPAARPIEVIPCCVDFEHRFAADRDELRERFRRQMNIEDRFVFVHAGALGGLYLTNEIADFLQTALERDRKTFALFLTQSDPRLIVPLLRERGFSDGDYFVGKVSPAEIPGYLCASDAGLSFVKAGYATQSRSPTKIPEYLACGLPIVANRGVGDVDKLVVENGVGVLIDECSEAGFQEAIDELEKLGNIWEKCRQTAVRDFDLQSVGGKRYRRLYTRLAAE